MLVNAQCIFVSIELQSTQKDLEQMKKQAEGVSKEYDRLLAEHDKLQVNTLLLLYCLCMLLYVRKVLSHGYKSLIFVFEISDLVTGDTFTKPYSYISEYKRHVYNFVINAGLEIVGCQWLKAGHILEMAGKNKFELPSQKEMACKIL